MFETGKHFVNTNYKRGPIIVRLMKPFLQKKRSLRKTNRRIYSANLFSSCFYHPSQCLLRLTYNFFSLPLSVQACHFFCYFFCLVKFHMSLNFFLKHMFLIFSNFCLVILFYDLVVIIMFILHRLAKLKIKRKQM